MDISRTREPSYIQLFKTGELHDRRNIFDKLEERCELCPNQCMVNRKNNERGACKGYPNAVVSSATPHFGEEEPLVGSRGSGTIFFCHCPLCCLYCQNYEISQLGIGDQITDHQLCDLMLQLQNCGCHNINLVTPTHSLSNIIRALIPAIADGLRIPIVYNTSGYEALNTLRLLDGIVDIYMPDFKYWNEEIALQYSGIRNYPETARSALKEMFRQVGDLKCDDNGVAYRGLLVRHLVLPNDVGGSCDIMRFIANDISVSTYVNIMDQYRPSYHAMIEKKLNRGITAEEYNRVVRCARAVGLYRGF
jgi:putative pyruvate formate lyase activating enzyme